MRILIVEDDQKIANALKKGLERQAYAVDVALNGKDGYDLARVEQYDLIILDRMLPGKDGIEIAKDLREEHISIPILMLTAKDRILDRVEGLNAGADDYLVKPFAFIELLARVKALLRRGRETVPSSVTHKDIELDRNTFCVTRANQEIPLTAKEFSLLEYLMLNEGQVLSKEQIIQHVWDYDADVLLNTVEVYIGYLRNKIDKPFPDLPRLIITRRGFGYMFGGVHE